MAREVVLVLLFICLCDAYSNCSTPLKVKEDPNLDAIVRKVRENFLATRPTPVTRLDIALLIPTGDPIRDFWRLGTYNPYETAYPARLVMVI
jgi:hypothetical protein